MLFTSKAVWRDCLQCALNSHSYTTISYCCSAVWEIESILGHLLPPVHQMIISYCLFPCKPPCRIFSWIELRSSTPSCQATTRESDWLDLPHLASDWLQRQQTTYIALPYCINQIQTGDAGNKDESLGSALKRINA